MPTVENAAELLAGRGDTPLRTGVCVIGSGPAGAIVAVELAAAGIDVIVLESGSRHPDHRTGELVNRVDAAGTTDIRYGFSRQLGGATNLWSGRLAPLDPIDFRPRPWVPESGWPLTAAELEPYYVRGAAVLGIPGHDLFRRHHASPGDVFASSTVAIKVFQWARAPFHAGEYLTAAANRMRNLTVVLNAPVTELVETPDARAIDAAAVHTPAAGSVRIRARAFVVAAGGMETPRLLLNSRGVRPHGVGNDTRVVGRYLSTHPKANMASLILNRRISTRDPLFSDRSADGGVIRHGIGLSERAQEEHRLLNHYVQLLPLFEHEANRLFEKIKGSRTVKSPLIDRAPLIAGVLPGIGLVAFDAIGRLGGVQRRARKFVLRAFLDQYPDPDNRVALSGARDANGVPRVDVTWRFSERDRASVLAFFAALDADVRARGLGRVDYGRLRAEAEWPITGLHSHFMGTTRMGTDARTSVTNPDGRVHGSDNLFVAGPSLFPTYGFANPVYTIGALSLRLADHLKDRMQ